MATALAVNKTILNGTNTDDPKQFYIGAGQYQAHTYCIMDQYEATTLADESTIAIADLPENAKIIDILVHHDALGSSTTLSIGDTNTAALYSAAEDTSSAGTVGITKIAGIQYQCGSTAGDNIILLTVGGAAITGTIKVNITYTLGE